MCIFPIYLAAYMLNGMEGKKMKTIRANINYKMEVHVAQEHA